MKKQTAFVARCAICDSDNLEYGSITVDPDTENGVYFPYTCSDCGAKGREVYTINFLHNEASDEKGG